MRFFNVFLIIFLIFTFLSLKYSLMLAYLIFRLKIMISFCPNLSLKLDLGGCLLQVDILISRRAPELGLLCIRRETRRYALEAMLTVLR